MDTFTLLAVILLFVGGVSLMQSWILGRLDAIAERIVDLSINQKELYLKLHEMKYPEGKIPPEKWTIKK